jgi:adenosylcobinamide-GDP ribazoletransferase
LTIGGKTTAPRGAAGSVTKDCRLALAFLTILPVRVADPGPDGLSRATTWFPLVGALLGVLAGGVRALGQPLFGPLPATVLAILALVVLTGALHQDGLADTADGLGARGNRERRLAAMRDPAIGVFGVLALLGWGLLLVSTLASLTSSRALAALITAETLARWAALLHATGAPPARTDGLGAAFHVGRVALLVASATAIAAAWLVCGVLPGLAALGAAALVAAASAVFARRTLQGRTGDTLGATVALSEVAICLVLLAIWHS